MILILSGVMLVLAATAAALVYYSIRSNKMADERLKEKFMEILQKEKPDPANFPDSLPEDVITSWAETQWNNFKMELP